MKKTLKNPQPAPKLLKKVLKPRYAKPAICKLLSVILAVGLTGLSVPASAAVGDTLYVSDELTVPLRSGPSGGHRILHRGLPSGTVLEFIEEDEAAGFTHIRTQRGTEGWIRSQYLTATPIAKIKLEQANAEIAQLQRALNASRNENVELKNTNATQVSANQSSSQRVRKLEQELERITNLSASALETHERNQQLNQENTRLRDELDDVAEERDLLEANNVNEGRMLGAGFVLLGLLAGVLIKSRPQRSSWD